MAQVTLYGTVDPNGNKAGGSSGWDSRQAGGGAGLYLVNFSPAFKSTPTVVVTQIYPNDLSSTGGDTRDNAVIVGADANEVKIKTGGSDGKGSNRWFNFVAMGDQ